MAALGAEMFTNVIASNHLTIPGEKLFLKETARMLNPEREAPFLEPVVNSKMK
jgi:hypothetical protein